MSVSELAEILQDPERVSQVQLVDVREEVEERVASVPDFQLKPLSRCISSLVIDVEFPVSRACMFDILTFAGVLRMSTDSNPVLWFPVLTAVRHCLRAKDDMQAMDNCSSSHFYTA